VVLPSLLELLLFVGTAIGIFIGPVIVGKMIQLAKQSKLEVVFKKTFFYQLIFRIYYIILTNGYKDTSLIGGPLQTWICLFYTESTSPQFLHEWKHKNQ